MNTVTFATQEALRFKNDNSCQIITGAGDRVQWCRYAAVITRAKDKIENEFTAGWEIVKIARRCFSLTCDRSAPVSAHGVRVSNKQIALLRVQPLLITYLVSGINVHCSRSRSEPMLRPDDLKNLDIDIEVLNGSQERVEIETMIQKKKRSGQKSNEGYCNYHTNGHPIINKV